MSDSRSPTPELGHIVQAARKNKKLTLEKLSELSGVSKSMLSQIERSAVSPTFSVLWNITQSLGIDLGTLDQRPVADNIIGHTHAYSTPNMKSVDGKCMLRMLAPDRTVLPIEWYQIIAEPGGELTSQPHATDTYEHLTCTRGTLEVKSGALTAVANTGDTLRYRADLPHSIKNIGEDEAEGFLVVALPAQYHSHRV